MAVVMFTVVFKTSEFLYWLPHNLITSKLYSLYLLKTVYMKHCSHQTQRVPWEQPYPSAQQMPILNAPFTAIALTIRHNHCCNNESHTCCTAVLYRPTYHRSDICLAQCL